MMDEVLIEKGITTPWQLTIREAAIFMSQTGAESMLVGMKFKSGKTLQVRVSIVEPESQE